MARRYRTGIKSRGGPGHSRPGIGARNQASPVATTGDAEVPWQPIPDCRGLRIRRCFRHFRLGPFDCRSLLGATAALFPELLFAASTPPTLGMVTARRPELAFPW